MFGRVIWKLQSLLEKFFIHFLNQLCLLIFLLVPHLWGVDLGVPWLNTGSSQASGVKGPCVQAVVYGGIKRKQLITLRNKSLFIGGSHTGLAPAPASLWGARRG